MTLGVLALVALVGAAVGLFEWVMGRKAAQEARAAFPDPDQEQERGTYELLRQIEGYEPTFRSLSRWYVRRRRSEERPK